MGREDENLCGDTEAFLVSLVMMVERGYGNDQGTYTRYRDSGQVYNIDNLLIIHISSRCGARL